MYTLTCIIVVQVYMYMCCCVRVYLYLKGTNKPYEAGCIGQCKYCISLCDIQCIRWFPALSVVLVRYSGPLWDVA